jgi:hypothetical protein
MTQKYSEYKQRTKEMAAEIKQLKAEIKKTQREGKYAGKLQWELPSAKNMYRVYHVALSLVRGKLYEQIEKPKEKHTLSETDWVFINQIKKEIEDEKNVCLSA